jgi:dihydroxy-acid dehydratase
MELLQRFLWMLESKGLLDKVVFISDGRFSGTNKGCAIAHVAPEAADAGPIAVVKDGDIIEIDIPNEKLTIDISEEELAKRLAAWEPPPQKVKKGYLSVYSKMAKSADKKTRCLGTPAPKSKKGIPVRIFQNGEVCG